jgi:HD-like signal output (HDOD) protein
LSKPSILFVDDEVQMLRSLRARLHRLRNEWDLRFTANGRDALRLLAKEPVDVVVTDYRMHGMNGIELLRTIRATHADAIRILFSGNIDNQLRASALQVAHRTLAKPCDAETIIRTIREVLDFRNSVDNRRIVAVVGSVERLPTPPALYLRLQEILRDPQAGINEVEAVVGEDPAATAQIMRMATSPLFCSRYPIRSLREAIIRLGTESIASVVLNNSLAAATSGDADADFIAKLAAHSVLTAGVARRLVPEKTLSAEAFLAALLHDAGLYLLADILPDEVAEVARVASSDDCTWSAAEQQVIGVTHGEVGAYLLDLWELPATAAEAAAFHHDPARVVQHGVGVLAAVHLADLAAYESGVGVTLHAEEADESAPLPAWFRQMWIRARALMDATVARTGPRGPEIQEQGTANA